MTFSTAQKLPWVSYQASSWLFIRIFLLHFLTYSMFLCFQVPYFLWNFNLMYYLVFIDSLISCPVVIENEQSWMLLSCIFLQIISVIRVRIYTDNYCQEVNFLNINECNIVWILIHWNKTECILFCCFSSFLYC